MPLLGAHMSIAGHPHKALLRGKETGCRVVQIFTRNRLRWSARGLSKSEIDSFFHTREKTSIIPVSIHGSYLINPATPGSREKKKSLSLLLNEIEWAGLLDIPYLVLHPGFHMGDGIDRGLERVAEMINIAFDRSPADNVNIILETTSGQGTGLGHRFEHLAEIIEKTGRNERLGVCFDTCHAFSAGYDFRNKEAYRQLMKEFDNLIGLNRLRLFHFNDSKNRQGSRRDRHEHPGKGLIGLRPFSFFLNDPMFREHPFLLETPKGVDERGLDMDKVNIKLLESLIRKQNTVENSNDDSI